MVTARYSCQCCFYVTDIKKKMHFIITIIVVVFVLLKLSKCLLQALCQWPSTWKEFLSSCTTKCTKNVHVPVRNWFSNQIQNEILLKSFLKNNFSIWNVKKEIGGYLKGASMQCSCNIKVNYKAKLILTSNYKCVLTLVPPNTYIII